MGMEIGNNYGGHVNSYNSTDINTNYSIPAYGITEQTKERVINESRNAMQTGIQNEKCATVEISQEGIKSYRENLERSAEAELQSIGGTKGILMTDFSSVIASKMPSIYGEQDKNGEYARNFYSVEETADNMLKAYAGLYDEIVTGHEAGTRETFVEDKTVESGYRKLTMDEELAELDKAYKNYADRYAARNDKQVIDALSAHAKKVSELSPGGAKIASEAPPVLERLQNGSVPKDFTQSVVNAARMFVTQYQGNRGMDFSENH